MCTGNETLLRSCRNGGAVPLHNCGHGEDASVVCPGEGVVVVGRIECIEKLSPS